MAPPFLALHYGGVLPVSILGRSPPPETNDCCLSARSQAAGAGPDVCQESSRNPSFDRHVA
jgi:hypothetical protein